MGINSTTAKTRGAGFQAYWPSQCFGKIAFGIRDSNLTKIMAAGIIAVSRFRQAIAMMVTRATAQHAVENGEKASVQ